jgi:hypothetical protein
MSQRPGLPLNQPAGEKKIKLRINTNRGDKFMFAANPQITISELAEQLKMSMVEFIRDKEHTYYDSKVSVRDVVNLSKETFYLRSC